MFLCKTCICSWQILNKPLLQLCDHPCSPTWPRRPPSSADTFQVLAAYCHKPPATAGGVEAGNLLGSYCHTGGLSLWQNEGDWPFEPPDIPKRTEGIMWYLTDPHWGIFFSLAAPRFREVTAQGESYNCAPGADRNWWSVFVRQALSLLVGWMLKPLCLQLEVLYLFTSQVKRSQVITEVTTVLLEQLLFFRHFHKTVLHKMASKPVYL